MKGLWFIALSACIVVFVLLYQDARLDTLDDLHQQQALARYCAKPGAIETLCSHPSPQP